MNKLAVNTLLAFLYGGCQLGFAADLAGTVRVALSNRPIVEPEKYLPAPSSWITLCSSDRAYRVQGDSKGRFSFVGVETGNYDLVAVAPGLAPDGTTGLKVSSDQSVRDLNVLVHDGARSSPCWVSSRGQATPFDYQVDYESPELKQNLPLIRGRSHVWVRGAASPRRVKPLYKAKIQLFRNGNPTPLSVLESDRQGRFEFRTESGVYELLMTRKGSHDVRVPSFLVPRENATVLSVATSDIDTVVLDQ